MKVEYFECDRCGVRVIPGEIAGGACFALWDGGCSFPFDLCEGCWLHVSDAIGGKFAAVRRLRVRIDGRSKAAKK